MRDDAGGAVSAQRGVWQILGIESGGRALGALGSLVRLREICQGKKEQGAYLGAFGDRGVYDRDLSCQDGKVFPG